VQASPSKRLAAIEKFLDASADHVHLHQVGPDQTGFFNFYQKEIVPALRKH
jgi:coenzyme F420-dependent glucose-6-phosphate dehydrogenase